MVTRLHDDEPDTSPRVVRTLLQHQFPEVAGLPLERLSNTGSDNALFRLGSRYVCGCLASPMPLVGLRSS